ncbi:hypothetical protein CsSME_00010788 [Camellia sinensis var. sinensis]
MIKRWQYTHSLKNTLFCLCLLSIAAKKRIPGKGWPTATNSGRPASGSGSGRQPPMVADRPPVEELFQSNFGDDGHVAFGTSQGFLTFPKIKYLSADSVIWQSSLVLALF